MKKCILTVLVCSLSQIAWAEGISKERLELCRRKAELRAKYMELRQSGDITLQQVLEITSDQEGQKAWVDVFTLPYFEDFEMKQKASLVYQDHVYRHCVKKYLFN